MCARDRVYIVYNMYNKKSFPSKITGIFPNRRVIASLLIRRADQDFIENLLRRYNHITHDEIRHKIQIHDFIIYT